MATLIDNPGPHVGHLMHDDAAPIPEDFADEKKIDDLKGGSARRAVKWHEGEQLVDKGKTASVFHGVVEGTPAFVGGMLPGQRRVYESEVISKMKREGKTDVSCIEIKHEIYVRKLGFSNLAGGRKGPSNESIDMSFLLNATLFEDCKRILVKQGGRSELGAFSQMVDLSGALAVGVGAVLRYVNTGDANWRLITANNDCIMNRDSVKDRVEVPNNSVYLPYPGTGSGAYDSWLGCVACVLGTGAVVLSDGVPTDSAGAPCIAVPSGPGLVRCILAAVSEMLAIHEESNVGCIGLYSVCRGWFSECGVVPILPENDGMNDIFPYGHAPGSYGVVPIRGASCKMLPMPAVVDVPTVRKWADGIGLYVAAMGTMSDPCEERDGIVYPTVVGCGDLSANIEQKPVPGERAQLDIQAELTRKMHIIGGLWAKCMGESLAECAGASDLQEAVDKVVSAIRRGVTAHIRGITRNVTGRCFAPFLWCEAQNLVGDEFATSALQRCGLGVYVPRGKGEVSIQAFEKITVLGGSSSEKSQIHLAFSAARRNPGIAHLRCSKVGGLEFMIPRQMRDDTAVLCGSRPDHASDFNVRAYNCDNFDDYMWAHSGNRMSAVVEFLQYSPGISMNIFHSSGGPTRRDAVKLFEGTVADMQQELKMHGTQPRLVTIARVADPCELFINRNNMLTLCQSRMSCGMTIAPRWHLAALCSNYASGSPLVAGDYKMSEPLRLMIVAHLDSKNADAMMVRMREARERLDDERGRYGAFEASELAEWHNTPISLDSYGSGDEEIGLTPRFEAIGTSKAQTLAEAFFEKLDVTLRARQDPMRMGESTVKGTKVRGIDPATGRPGKIAVVATEEVEIKVKVRESGGKETTALEKRVKFKDEENLKLRDLLDACVQADVSKLAALIYAFRDKLLEGVEGYEQIWLAIGRGMNQRGNEAPADDIDGIATGMVLLSMLEAGMTFRQVREVVYDMMASVIFDRQRRWEIADDVEESEEDSGGSSDEDAWDY